MNILIPHTWLLEHLETKATPEEIQKFLSLCGPSVERIYEREGEPVYDIEVTTNRVDSMSVRGIAREAAVILPQFGIPATLKPLNFNRELEVTGKPLPLPEIKNNPEFCHRIMGVVLSNVEHSPTPEWMGKRLRQIEVNVHDSMIDITNYITHELGHPCHAFDYDQLMKLGGKIIVKEAEKGKKFSTLDGVEYTTVGGEIVFENEEGIIIDLPGIKGTANTSITDQTQTVFLELEAINHQKIRFASMTHAIRTVAAQLNEKQVDPHLAEPVLYEGIKRYQELCGAQVSSRIFDEFPGQKDSITITVPLKQISNYLGIDLKWFEIELILKKLECVTSVSSEGHEILVQPPTFRPDLEIPADVIEEIARIYGYHNLQSVVMPTPIPLNRPKDVNFSAENKVKHFLSDIGWQELYTYSLVSQEVAEESGYPLADHLKLDNPLTDDRVYLRRSLIPSLEEIISQNPQASPLSVFEIANIYHPTTGKLPKEELHLTLVSTKEYRQVKGDVEAMLDRFFVKNVKVKATAPSHKYQQAGEIVADNHTGDTVTLGKLGLLPTNHIVVDIVVSKLWQVINSHPVYRPIPKTTPVVEDMTFTLSEGVAIGEIIDRLKQESPLIHAINLADVYQRNHTFTFEYLNQETNLSSQDVEPLRKRMAEILAKEFNGQLVGSV